MKPALLNLLLSNGIPTTTLPQYLTSSAPVLTEDFEVIGNWTAGTGSVAANTSEFKTGTKSVKVTSASGTAGTATRDVNWDFSAVAQFRIWVYLHDVANTLNVSIYFSQSNFAKFKQAIVLASAMHTGWNALELVKADFTDSGSANWNAAFDKFRVRISANPGQTPAASFDRFETLTQVPYPAVMLVFDDGYANNYTEGYAYCRPRRVPCTVYAVSDLIGTAGFMTVAQLQELNVAGWDIGNHTKDHTNLTTLTEAQQETELTACQTALEGWGLTRASKHAAYPYGGYNADTLTAMAATGMLTGRTIIQQTRQMIPPGDNHYIEIRTLANVTTLAAAKAYIDAAIARGNIMCLLLHKLVASPSVDIEWSIADFQALVDYILQVKIQPITISQFYALQSGSAIVQQPVW